MSYSHGTGLIYIQVIHGPINVKNNGQPSTKASALAWGYHIHVITVRKSES